MLDDTPPKGLTFEEVAKILKISEIMVDRMVDRGELRTVGYGRNKRITHASFERYYKWYKENCFRKGAFEEENEAEVPCK